MLAGSQPGHFALKMIINYIIIYILYKLLREVHKSIDITNPNMK
jgi:hypothetical protein